DEHQRLVSFAIYHAERPSAAVREPFGLGPADYSLLGRWEIPHKKMPAPLAAKKINNEIPRGEPHDKTSYKTSITLPLFWNS
ncbi:MAG: hypothetical protein KDI55_29115, partial [Anaerolineae bacterium]|nr:hypothetical protein [Anaerolineae bacterium]